MSIQVQNLTKKYGNQYAIDGLDFELNRGEIVGFLGPNGAGKTTTMKILTGYIPSSEGSAHVCDIEVLPKNKKVKKYIGYLPEHNPLYLEMYVTEYLDFISQVQGIQNKKERIEEMIERTGLGPERHKRISSLSKGYRQRVGLAQAMLHDPEVLILDEPTSGLDPNQLVEIRNLIRDFGKDKTVLFSSHIMQEIQALCTRVIILNKGKIVADEPIDRLNDLVKGNKRIHLEFENAVNSASFQNIDGVVEVNPISHSKIELSIANDNDIRASIFNHIVKEKWTLLEMKQEESSVENVFQLLTKND